MLSLSFAVQSGPISIPIVAEMIANSRGGGGGAGGSLGGAPAGAVSSGGGGSPAVGGARGILLEGSQVRSAFPNSNLNFQIQISNLNLNVFTLEKPLHGHE